MARETVRSSITIDGDAYHVMSARTLEALSAVPTLAAEITGDAGAPDPGTLIDKMIELTIARSDSHATRSFFGVVIEAARSQDKDGRPSVALVAAPRLFKLGLRADCRVFQDLTVPDIVKKVLSEAKIAEADQSWSLKATYEKRVYTAQYRETDLDFIRRLLAEEGISFTTKFDDKKDEVAFTDDPKGFADVKGLTKIPFEHTYGFDTSEEHVLWVKQVQEVRSDKVFMRDYDPDRPKLKIEADAEGKDAGGHGLEVYAYPGKFLDVGVGKRVAQVLLDSMQAERNIVSGEATGMNLEAGCRFSIIDHPYELLNQEYLVTSVEVEVKGERAFHSAASEGGRDYTCRFTAVPTKTSPYRPARREPSRIIPGMQSAITTGPAGQEVYSDKHGRVKAQFHWDRLGKKDDKSSLWMRTSQVPTGGSMLLPRVNWEVGVCYLEGDADRPVVMGRLYNAVAPPPYALPAGKARGSLQTATTPGGGTSNELRMDDTKGTEEMFINASKDFTVDVGNNGTESIGNNETHTIGGNHVVNITNSVTSTIGSKQSITVTGARTEHVETFKVDQIGGSFTHNITGNRDMKVGGDHRQSVTGNSTLAVTGKMIDLVVGSVSESAADMTHKVSAALIEATGADRAVTIVGAHNESTAALKAIIAKGGRGVDVTGSLTQKVAGAIINKIDGDRADTSSAGFMEVAAGAQIIKCENATFEGKSVVTFVMGASTITMTPSSISIAGISIKIDGAAAETSVLILDN